MKKIVLLLAIFAISVSCMDKYEDTLQELGERVDKLEQKIPTIDQQIESIKESISLLEEADKALKAKDEELSNADRNLENLISELKQYVNNEINATKSWAEASLFTLQKYNSAVSALARLEQSIASDKNAASQEISDAVSALRTSFQRWVGEQLAGHYSIAKADAEFDALRKSIEAGDEKLQGEIDDLQTAIAKSATDLTEAYQKAIEEAINDHNGVITDALNKELGEVNKRLDEELATINAKLTALEAQIGKNAEDIAKLIARIQSISYIHKYADGKATMLQNSSMYSASLSFEVSPKDVAAPLAKVWKDVVSAKAVCSGADEASFVALPIQSLTADEENGIISVSISGTSLPENVLNSQQEVKIAISISNGIDDITSDYIPAVVKSISGNAICYTSVDGNIIEPQTSAFDANIVSNTYDEGIGIIVFDAPITTIGDYAFDGCTNLTSISYPTTITSLGRAAFRGCSNIATFTLGENITRTSLATFFGMTGELIINSKIIEQDADNDDFKSMVESGYSLLLSQSKFSKITIGDNIETIGKNKLVGCFYVTEFDSKFASPDKRCLIVDGTLVAFAQYEMTEYVIPDNVTKIGDYTFGHFGATGEENKFLTKITIPDSVTEIGEYAFAGCSSLTSVTIPDSVTKIGVGAFYNCSSLTSVTIGDSVTEIGGSAFSYCSSLTSVTIPDSVTEIGGSAFYGCSSLTSVIIPDSVTSIGYSAFKGCSSLISVTIPDSVTSIGSYAFDGCSSLTDINVNITDLAAYIQSNNTHNLPGNKHLLVDGVEITELVIPDSVTSIGRYAFYDCSLTSITIGDSVTSIGGSAFYGCTGELIINSKVVETDYDNFDNYPAYYGWLNGAKFTKITIGDSVTKIGNYVFYKYEGQTSVTIPDSVTSIGSYAFFDCSLTSVTIGNGVTEIGGHTFRGCNSLTSVTIGDSVTEIGEEAFSGCSSLTCVTIPDSVTEIGGSAFSYCSSLTSFYGKYASNDNRCLIIDGVLRFFAPAGLTQYTIPDSVTKIGGSAFSYCSSLTSVTIPDNVTSIGGTAFYECSSLKSVTIPDSVTEIGKSAFYECTGELIINSKIVETNYASDNYPMNDGWLYGSKFTKLTIGNGVTKIGEMAFYNCSSLTSITIPDSVTSIGDYAFYNCRLTSVTIPDSVTEIGRGAFSGCSSLTSVTIPDSVKYIGEYAFYNCSRLTHISIPKSVSLIGEYAFYNCSRLASVYCNPTTPPRGGDYMFRIGTYIYVPHNSLNTYKSAQYWRNYADYIIGK